MAHERAVAVRLAGGVAARCRRRPRSRRRSGSSARPAPRGCRRTPRRGQAADRAQPVPRRLQRRRRPRRGGTSRARSARPPPARPRRPAGPGRSGRRRRRPRGRAPSRRRRRRGPSPAPRRSGAAPSTPVAQPGEDRAGRRRRPRTWRPARRRAPGVLRAGVERGPGQVEPDRAARRRRRTWPPAGSGSAASGRCPRTRRTRAPSRSSTPSPLCPNGGWPRSWASAAVSARSGWQPSGWARSRATWATSRLWVSRLRTKSSVCRADHLGLGGQPAQRGGVDDPGPVALERRALGAPAPAWPAPRPSRSRACSSYRSSQASPSHAPRLGHPRAAARPGRGQRPAWPGWRPATTM